MVIGAGSMGRRRLRDLNYLNEGNVIFYEPAEERCKEVTLALGIEGFTDLDEAWEQEPEILCVSTPPALHEKYVLEGMERGLHIFSEMPFVLDHKALAEISAKSKSYPSVLGISCTMRYFPPCRLIHDLLRDDAIGKPLYMEYSLGNYLPNWHPYEDYRKFYGSDMAMGGAGLDMIPHEFANIFWWLGDFTSVYARLSKLSSLEIKGPDTHTVLISFQNSVQAIFHNDIIDRASTGRKIRIIGESGTIEWYQNQTEVLLFDGKEHHRMGYDRAANWEEAIAASREVSDLLDRQSKAPSGGSNRKDRIAGFTYESCYLNEMKHFMGAVRGKHPYRIKVADELKVMRAFHAVLGSSEKQQRVMLGS